MNGKCGKPPIHATNSQCGCGKYASTLRPAIGQAGRRKAKWRKSYELGFNICVLKTLTKHISGNLLAHKALRTLPFCSAKRAVLEAKTARNGSPNGTFDKPKRHKAEDGGKVTGDSCTFASNDRSEKPHCHIDQAQFEYQQGSNSKESHAAPMGPAANSPWEGSGWGVPYPPPHAPPFGATVASTTKRRRETLPPPMYITLLKVFKLLAISLPPASCH